MVSGGSAADTRGLPWYTASLSDISNRNPAESRGEEESPVIEAYLKHEAERKEQGVPPKPLDPEQTRELVKLLQKPPKGQEAFLLGLLENRVSPGVDPAAEVKAGFLAEIVKGKKKSP